MEILKTCRQAMGEQTNLILVQRVLPDRAEESRMARVMSAIDLQMMVTTGGRERTVTEHRELLETCSWGDENFRCFGGEKLKRSPIFYRWLIGRTQCDVP